MNPMNAIHRYVPTKSAPELKGNEDAQGLKEVTQDFEAVFINMMLKQMRATVSEGGLTEKSYGRGIFEEMQDENMAEVMSKGRGIGIAQELYRQLSHHVQPRATVSQEASNQETEAIDEVVTED
ncbi:Rod binding protein-like protein [Alkaliphilus metalliredigens QYMF]|uniref:Rod binding protein-like protein n=1 Tax=Alkaliphilus metalliredigens (strain QYMF) TaxID=293826 RepID=A6TK83_ALKMQ|nr:rod-binding protein [Alkaliphilus metalliredigens]ABR46601.1 Rod binding protein-like protein [Alkaliphilus metalliredigens QYMF]